MQYFFCLVRVTTTIPLQMNETFLPFFLVTVELGAQMVSSCPVLTSTVALIQYPGQQHSRR